MCVVKNYCVLSPCSPRLRGLCIGTFVVALFPPRLVSSLFRYVGVVVSIPLFSFVCVIRFVLCSRACVGVCVVLLCVGLFVR